MNGEAFNTLIDNFDPHDEALASKMASVIEKYPYFQLPRFFYTQSLKDQKKDDLDKALNQLALYTYDRGNLKKKFESLSTFPKKTKGLVKKTTDTAVDKKSKGTLSPKEDHFKEAKEDIPVLEGVETSVPVAKEKKTAKKGVVKKKKLVPKEEKSPKVPQNNTVPANLKMSFTDWIDFTEQKLGEIGEFEKNPPSNDKWSIIDRFIATEPKISPLNKTEITDSVVKEDFYVEELMTETLAKLLVKQKKYKKAISAYKILSLKYPEKNVFFAGEIQKLKKLQQQ